MSLAIFAISIICTDLQIIRNSLPLFAFWSFILDTSSDAWILCSSFEPLDICNLDYLLLTADCLQWNRISFTIICILNFSIGRFIRRVHMLLQGLLCLAIEVRRTPSVHVDETLFVNRRLLHLMDSVFWNMGFKNKSANKCK